MVGGTLRIGVQRPTGSAGFDPARAPATSPSQLLLADLLFDGLPQLAATSRPSTDGQTWIFTLRPDERFSDGSPVTAGDVKTSLQRVVAQGDRSLAALRLDAVTGWAALTQGRTNELIGIKARDARTVEIHLDRPVGSLADLLANPEYGILRGAKAALVATGPVGSGPFRLASVQGSIAHLVRRAPGSALLDGIDVHLYDDLAGAYADFATGKLDWSLVPAASAPAAAAAHGRSGFVPFQAELFYAFNLADPVFAKVAFRQAIVQSIDRDAVVNAALADVAVPLNGAIPQGVPGHVDDDCGGACRFDTVAAKALLLVAFPDGKVPAINVDYYEGNEESAIAKQLQTALAAVGVRATLRPHPAAAYAAFVASGKAGLYRFGWVGGGADTDSYLTPLFGTRSRDNASGFSDKGVDALLAKAHLTADADAGRSYEQQAERAILAKVPILPLAQFLTRSVADAKVRDLRLNVGGTFDGSRVWLAPP